MRQIQEGSFNACAVYDEFESEFSRDSPFIASYVIFYPYLMRLDESWSISKERATSQPAMDRSTYNLWYDGDSPELSRSMPRQQENRNSWRFWAFRFAAASRQLRCSNKIAVQRHVRTVTPRPDWLWIMSIYSIDYAYRAFAKAACRYSSHTLNLADAWAFVRAFRRCISDQQSQIRRRLISGEIFSPPRDKSDERELVRNSGGMELSFAFCVTANVNYTRDALGRRGVNCTRGHFRVNNNIRLTDMQISIVYVRIHGVIVSARIIIRFYPSLAQRGT